MNPKNIEFRKKWLQWVLDFSQTDLGSLSRSRMKALLEEIAYFCSERLFKQSWEELKEDLQDLTPGEYEGVTQIGDRTINLNKIQKGVFDFLTDLSNIHGGEDFTYLSEKDTFKIHHPLGPIRLPEMSSFIAASSQGFEIYRHPKTDSLPDWLIVNFIELIERCEAYPIKKCKGCNRFFLNLTRFKKIYCTSSCASRSIVSMKYQELKNHPKEYEVHLEKHSKYSRKRYEKLRRAEFGPNIKIRKLGRKRKKSQRIEKSN
jgi:hypothetical protein